MTIGAIIMAGGTGARAGGDRPKQLQDLGGLPVFVWSLRAFVQHPRIDHVVLVTPGDHVHLYKTNAPDSVQFARGGQTRTQSVRSGLQALKNSNCDIVLIHDAARPGITASIISELLSNFSDIDAIAPALQISDALKRGNEQSFQTVPREKLYRVQTPQVFHYNAICNALTNDAADYVDDLAAIEALGGKIQLIQGTERLAKITYPEDLQHMAQILAPLVRTPRIGTGFDVHEFEQGSSVTLCGIAIPHDHALAGHSDADVAWHALTDAILGALALGDIGDHFPPSEAKWKDADSAQFLGHAAKLAKSARYRIENCDLTIICEAPKVKPYRESMRARTAEILGLDLSAVSVKATTTEGLGFTGRREGIAAQAVAVLSALPSHA